VIEPSIFSLTSSSKPSQCGSWHLSVASFIGVSFRVQIAFNEQWITMRRALSERASRAQGRGEKAACAEIARRRSQAGEAKIKRGFVVF
jgi:hypothetical protein